MVTRVSWKFQDSGNARIIWYISASKTNIFGDFSVSCGLGENVGWLIYYFNIVQIQGSYGQCNLNEFDELFLQKINTIFQGPS